MREGAHAEAVRLLELALESPRFDRGERPFLVQNLATALLLLGRRDEARLYFESLRAPNLPLSLAHSARVALAGLAHADGDVSAMAALVDEGMRDIARSKSPDERSLALSGLRAVDRPRFEAIARRLANRR